MRSSGDFARAHAVVELLSASLMVGATTSLLFLTARRFLSAHAALVLAFAFAFGTSAWSTASRALWQHTPSMLLLAAALWIAVKALDRPALIQFASIPLSLAFCVRPTNAVAAAVFTVLVAVHYRRWLAPYILYAILAAAAFFAYNWSVYGRLLLPYYSVPPGPAQWATALAGLLLSPSRGVLVFTRWLVFAVWGAILAWRRALPPVFRYAGAVVAMHTLVLVVYSHLWWGGHSYGPRLFTDMMPIFVLCAIPVIGEMKASPALAYVFAVLLLISVVIHARGALSPAVHRWNVEPVNVDPQPERVWDWTDPQFLRR